MSRTVKDALGRKYTVGARVAYISRHGNSISVEARTVIATRIDPSSGRDEIRFRFSSSWARPYNTVLIGDEQ